MKRILYLCDLNSIHSVTFIGNIQDTFDSKIDYHIASSTYFTENTFKGRPVHNLTTGLSLRQKKDRYTACLKLLNLFPMIKLKFSAWLTKRQILSARIRLKSILNELKPDIVHVFRTIPEGIMLNGLDFSSHLILTVWGNDLILFARTSRWMVKQTRRLLQDTDYLLPDTNRDAALAIKLGLNKQADIKVLPANGGLDLHLLDQVKQMDLGIGHGKIKVLISRGYDHFYHDLFGLLGLFARFLPEHPEVHLIIDGPSNDPAGKAKAMKTVQRLGLETQTSFVHLSRTEFLGALKSCDIFSYNTTYDGLPISLLESMYLGAIPFIRFSEGYRDILEDGKNGFFFEPACFTDKIETAILSVRFGKGREMIENNLALIRDRFTKERVMKHFPRIYSI